MFLKASKNLQQWITNYILEFRKSITYWKQKVMAWLYRSQ